MTKINDINIPCNLFDRMIGYCRDALPNEACGFFAGRGVSVTHYFEIPSIDPSPASYFMDPSAQFLAMREIREKGLEMSVIFHSHPQAAAYPSSKDVSLAFYDDAVYLIVGLADPDRPVVRGYRIMEGKVAEVNISKGDQSSAIS